MIPGKALLLYQKADRDDISQLCHLYGLEGRTHPLIRAIHRHTEFIQYSQGKTTTKTVGDFWDSNVYRNHVFFNELADDILTLFANESEEKQRKVAGVVEAFSMGMSQHETAEHLGISQASVSYIKADIKNRLNASKFKCEARAVLNDS